MATSLLPSRAPRCTRGMKGGVILSPTGLDVGIRPKRWEFGKGAKGRRGRREGVRGDRAFDDRGSAKPAKALLGAVPRTKESRGLPSFLIPARLVVGVEA